MAKQLFLNNFTSTFIAAVKDTPSSGTPATELDYGILRLSDGAAGALINPTGGDYYVLTGFKRSGSIESNIEVMRVTAVDNSTPGECRITVMRAQEGTSAKAFVSGDYVSLRMTKGTAERFSQPDDLATKEPVITAGTSAQYWRGDKSWQDFATDVRAATLAGLSTATNAVIAAADTVLGALGKLQAQITGHTSASSGAHAASAISNTPAGNIAATTVQAAINELDSEKQATLVSGTNIKTAGGQNLVGSGDAPIVAPETHAATDKTTPVDADELGITDSAASWGLKKLTFANLKAWIGGLFVSKSGDTMTGNLNFSGTGLRLTGDFSNATVANRMLFQTNAANTNTIVQAIPSGSGTVARWNVANASDPANASEGSFAATSTEIRVESTLRGTGSYLPMTFYTGGSERLRIDTSGNVRVTGGGRFGGGTDRGLVTFNTVFGDGASAQNITLGTPGTAQGQKAGVAFYPTFTGTSDNGPRRAADIWSSFSGTWGTERLSFGVGRGGSTANDEQRVTLETLALTAAGEVLAVRGALGYGVGAGGTVTQPTSNTSNVSLNKPNGVITLANGSITGGGIIVFQLENTFITANSIVVVHGSFTGTGSGIAQFTPQVNYVQTGVAYIQIKNNNAGAVATDGVTIRFAVFAGSAS